jgi:protein-L-isoaspartate(D-aspartate) O-methyltransferase
MADFAAARVNMVDSQVRTQDVTDVRIHDAMRAILREAFMPEGKAYLAYADTEAEYAAGRWLLRPRDVAKLIQALEPLAGERALAISAPYAAAVLEHMGAAVELAAGEDLRVLPGRGYSIIVVEGAVARAPQSWLDALSIGGRLAVVERDGPVGKACLYVKAHDGVGRRVIFDSTPPVIEGFAAQHGFAF